MTVIQSGLTLLDYGVKWGLGTTGGISLYEGLSYDYATIYKTQPNVRTCVDFLARNVAQLGLHVFKRVSDTDRKRLRAADHPLARVIEHPNAWMTTYRFTESLMADLGIYLNSYWLKRIKQGKYELLRIPPSIIQTVGGSWAPDGYKVTYADGQIEYACKDIVHYGGYDPTNLYSGLSPLETLRRVLAEEQASGDYRENFWQNAARINGVIERPSAPAASKWSDDARERFKKDLSAYYSGAANAGKTMVLEDGMTWKQNSFNAQESEYLAGRKLTREECARAYHIPLPMVGILDNATFSNIREQHKNLYQDCLGPWLRMIEQEIELQIAPDLDDPEDVYCEFNIAEKLAGSFEEQTSALSSAIQKPWMTPNEARARMNLPSIEGGDTLGLPLNMADTGGNPDTVESTEPKADAEVEFKATGRIDPTRMQLRKRYGDKWAEVLGKYFKRQGQSIRSRAGDGNIDPATLWIDKERWKKELKDELFKLGIDTAWAWASYVAAATEARIAQEPMEAYVLDSSERTAGYLTDATERDTVKALSAEDPKGALGQVFDALVTVTAVAVGVSEVTQMANFGAHEGARQGGLKTKTWQVNSVNPRNDHAALNGTTVGLDDIFYQTGQRWPGDPAGGAENNANCQCSVVFNK